MTLEHLREWEERLGALAQQAEALRDFVRDAYKELDQKFEEYAIKEAKHGNDD